MGCDRTKFNCLWPMLVNQYQQGQDPHWVGAGQLLNLNGKTKNRHMMIK